MSGLSNSSSASSENSSPLKPAFNMILTFLASVFIRQCYWQPVSFFNTLCTGLHVYMRNDHVELTLNKKKCKFTSTYHTLKCAFFNEKWRIIKVICNCILLFRFIENLEKETPLSVTTKILFRLWFCKFVLSFLATAQIYQTRKEKLGKRT